MTDPSQANKIGVDLLNYASDGVGAGKHGIITQIFPFVVEASRKKGLRAISGRLRERGLGVSHSTISRALREPLPHWKGYFTGWVKPHAKILSRAWDTPMRDFLFASSFDFEAMVLRRELDYTDQVEPETIRAIEILREGWFKLAAETRANCRPFAIDE